MSEPVRDSDIEDVLSSIRRLVSEEGRPMARPQAPEIKDKKPERLVLTPALRVAEVVPEPVVEPAPEPAFRAQEQPLVDDIVSDDVEGKEESDAPQPDDAVLVEATEPAEDSAARQPEFRHQNDREGPPPNEENLAPVDDQSKGEPAKEATQPETHKTETDDGSAERSIDDEWQDANVGDMAIADEMAPEDGEKDANKPKGEMRLEDRIVGLETAVAGRNDQWEPDGASDDDYSGGLVDSLPWEDSDTARKPRPPEPITDKTDDAEAYGDDELAEPFGAAEDKIDASASADLFAAEDTILDEETLRELVAEIVRQELQGSLGERITRNVRKLVRREIHRALASQDLQ